MCVQEGDVDVIDIDGETFVELESMMDLLRLAGERYQVHGCAYAATIVGEIVAVCTAGLGMVATTG